MEMPSRFSIGRILVVTVFLGNQLWISRFSATNDVRIVKESSRSAHHPDIARALECLGYASNVVQFDGHNISIRYPEDPRDHFHEIHEKLSDWSLSRIVPHKGPQYHGPWIEDHWQHHFQKKADSLTNDNFSSVFGPYIPLLPAWTDIWVARGYDDERLIKTLREVLRPEVLYITVCQNADGFPGDHDEFQKLQDDYNILILSAGGYGHVPIPLLKQPEKLQPKIPMGNRTHLVSYVGSRRNAPRIMRFQMLEYVGYEHYYYGSEWRSIMYDSKFSLCPRGFGRTSYHVMESLQMGLIPIQVYLDDDIPWLPYARTILANITFTSSLKGFPKLIQQLEQLPDHKIEQMEQEIESLIDDYFTYEGVLAQIQRFMVHQQQSALVCEPLPKHVGSNRRKYFS